MTVYSEFSGHKKGWKGAFDRSQAYIYSEFGHEESCLITIVQRSIPAPFDVE